MKKLLYLLLLMIIITAGWGCLRNSGTEIKPEPPKDLGQPMYQKQVGVLKESSTPLTEKKIKNVLETEIGDIIYLSSKFVDLSSIQYLDKKVEVTGAVAIEGTQSFMDVETINVLDNTLEIAEDANVWKNFEDAEIGFKIQYKGFLYPEKEGKKISFVSVKEKNEQMEKQNPVYTEMINIQRYDNPTQKDLSQWITDEEKIPAQNQRSSVIGADNFKAISVLSSSQNEMTYYTAREKYVYKLNHVSTGGEEKDNYRNLFNEMLRSFQFIEIVEEIKVEEDKNTEEGKETPSEEKTIEENKPTEKSEEEVSDKPQETPVNETNLTNNTETAKIEASTEIENETKKENYQKVVAEVGANIMSIAPEQPNSGTWNPTKYEFVEPDYVYVEYQAETEKRKVLLKYEIKTIQVETSVVGYFKPGADKDWETVSGKNEVAGKSREVITVGQSGEVKKELEVKEGYRYFESTTYKFKMQYPSNWYYNGSSGHYEFSDKPNGTGQELISLYILPESLSSFSQEGNGTTMNNKKAVISEKDGNITIFLEKSDGKVFKITGGSELSDFVKTMAGTIED